jgi:uncharacterized membrane protein YqjE
MSDVVEKEKDDAPAVETPQADVVVDIEEKRAVRDLKFFLVKAFALSMLGLFIISVLTLIYAAVFKEKDLNTTFIGEVFKMIFEFLQFLLA